MTQIFKDRACVFVYPQKKGNKLTLFQFANDSIRNVNIVHNWRHIHEKAVGKKWKGKIPALPGSELPSSQHLANNLGGTNTLSSLI